MKLRQHISIFQKNIKNNELFIYISKIIEKSKLKIHKQQITNKFRIQYNNNFKGFKTNINPKNKHQTKKLKEHIILNIKYQQSIHSLLTI